MTRCYIHKQKGVLLLLQVKLLTPPSKHNTIFLGCGINQYKIIDFYIDEQYKNPNNMNNKDHPVRQTPPFPTDALFEKMQNIYRKVWVTLILFVQIKGRVFFLSSLHGRQSKLSSNNSNSIGVGSPNQDFWKGLWQISHTNWSSREPHFEPNVWRSATSFGLSCHWPQSPRPHAPEKSQS